MLKQGACRLRVCDAEKLFANTIFSVSDMIPNFALIYMAAKISAALYYFLIKQQQMAFCIAKYYLSKPAVQFWGQTLARTFFFGKYLCVHICIS